MEYRVNISKKNGWYYIEYKQKYIFGFHLWKKSGKMNGAAGHAWFEIDHFNTKEEALKRIIELVDEDARRNEIITEIAGRVKEFEPINISSEDIKKKLPEYFL